MEAAGKSTPAGARTTEAAGTTTYSAYAPPCGPAGMTRATTRSPTLRRLSASAPSSSITRATSMPGTYGAGRPLSRAACEPARNSVSVGLTDAAWTRMRTSPAPACGSGSSKTCKTSGPPNVITPIAFIFVSPLPLSLPLSQESRREYGVPRERSAWPGWQRHSTPGEPGVGQRSRQPCAMAALPLVGR